MRFIRDVQTITLEATGGDDTRDVVMAAQDRAFRELTIWGVPVSPRVVGDAPIAKSFSTEVFFGPTSQAAAAARANDNVYLIYDPGNTVRIWPANDTTSNPERVGTRAQVRGFPITVQVINAAASPLVITLLFVAMSIDQG